MESYLKNQLITLLEERFEVLSPQHLDRPSWETVSKSKYAEEAVEVYRDLGGKMKWPGIQLPQDFILLKNDFVVFLDEALHFNRYRAQTLRSKIYEKMPLIPVDSYKTYCRKYEKECLKAGLAGKNWSFPFAEKHFGLASERGDFSKNGPPAWKLRALENFLLDSALLAQKVKVLRLSVYQQLMLNKQLYKIGDILISGREPQQTALLNYIERKISS